MGCWNNGVAVQTSLPPSNVFRLLKAFQIRYIIPPACSPSPTPGSPTSWTCLENLQGEATRMHPNQILETPQLVVFDTEEQWFYSELPPDVWLLPLGVWVFPFYVDIKCNPGGILEREHITSICCYKSAVQYIQVASRRLKCIHWNRKPF